VIALHRTAARERPREALPTVELGTVMARLGQGDVEAKRIMGMIFDPAFMDQSFTKDRSVAMTYYQQAAGQGDMTSARLLGELMVAPDNPLPDREQATKWLDIAADAGNPQAALRLAELLLEQQVDAAGRVKAEKYLRIATSDPSTSGLATALMRFSGIPVGPATPSSKT